MTTMGRWFSRCCLFSLYGHAVNTSCCLSVPSLVRWFVRSFVRSLACLLVGMIVRSLFSSSAPRCLSSFVPSRLVLAAAYRRLFVSFVRARRHSPSTEATVLFPTPVFSIARHRVLLSRVYAITRLLHLLLHLILLVLVSLSPALDPSRPPYHRALCVSDRR